MRMSSLVAETLYETKVKRSQHTLIFELGLGSIPDPSNDPADG